MRRRATPSSDVRRLAVGLDARLPPGLGLARELLGAAPIVASIDLDAERIIPLGESIDDDDDGGATDGAMYGSGTGTGGGGGVGGGVGAGESTRASAAARSATSRSHRHSLQSCPTDPNRSTSPGAFGCSRSS